MKRKSAAALIVCYLLMLYTGTLYYPRWAHTETESTISWDVSGYYMYLPALFIYKDIRHCGFKDSILSKYRPTPDFQQAFVHQESGNYVMKYSSGQAFLMAPFFFIAHQVAVHSTAYPADGFSKPYQVAIGLGMLLYAFIGLFVLRKVLLLYFKDGTVALTLIALVFGSNYLNYAAVDQAMTHSTLFMVYTLILWCSIRFWQQPGLRRGALAGLLCGFATLIRPTELIGVLLPVLWGVSSLAAFRDRLRFFLSRPAYILVFGLCFALVVSIQLCYWKYVSGDWVVYSYQDQGFSWLHPHLKDYLFSFECGWLRYSPMLFFAFIGLIPFIRRRQNVWAITLFFLVNVYIVTAWDVWWYGGRAMVQSYAVLFFPVAALIEAVNDGRRWLRWIFYPLYLLCIYLNIWWTHGAHRGHVQTTGVSEAYYWHTVGRWEADESIVKLLDDPDRFTGDTAKFRLIYSNSFDRDTTGNRLTEDDGNTAIYLDHERQNAGSYEVPLPGTPYRWARISADFKAVNREWDQWKMLQFIARSYYEGREVRANVLRVHRFLNDGEQRRIYMDVKLGKTDYDKLVITFWNAGSDRKTVIDNLKVYAQ